MIKNPIIKWLLLPALFGAWILVHYLTDKKSAEGLGIYVIIILGTFAYLLDRRISKNSKKNEDRA